MPRRIGEKRSVPERVIDTWYYKVKEAQFDQEEYIEPEDGDHGNDKRRETEKHRVVKKSVKNKLVKVELILHKTTTHSEEPPHPTASVEFEAVCEECGLKVSGTDIECIRAAIWERLDKQF